ncbi:hypothetical protein TM239_64260 [Bradyrhizobium sp. TM239]|nr:hypothetical protein TM233_29690 [Bradyrhizobium sp. TM233]GMP12093.1 hypothetical protein TM239_64260 [Bradyrhizobium sp. TM239]
MWDLNLSEYDFDHDAPQLAQMRAELIGIGEKERILRERSADREAYRYLLDAHRSSAGALSLRGGVEHFSGGRG